MQGSEIELDAGGTPFRAYRGRPPGGTGSGLVLLHEGFGLDDSIRERVERLARAGFIAVAPMLGNADVTRSPAEAHQREASLDPDLIATRVGRAIDALLGDPGCQGPRVGVVGLGGSAPLGLKAGADHPRVGAIVDLARLPEDLADARTKPGPRLLLVVGDEDPACSEEVLTARVQELSERGFDVAVRRQPGVGADFTSEPRVDHFDARAAAEAWDSAIAFLREAL
jgi:carboxymethylenebutenolidase